MLSKSASFRHQHRESSVTLVLEGSFEQAAYCGRMVLVPGDVLLQPTLDCHAHRLLSANLAILQMPWKQEMSFGGVFRVQETADDIRRAAARDRQEAASLFEGIFRASRPVLAPVGDWEDYLAAEIKRDPSLRIEDLARRIGKRREIVSRGFKRRYGVSPATFRGEIRARAAWVRVMNTRASLTQIAAEAGFADQPHMTREVKRLTGSTPALWRREINAANGTLSLPSSSKSPQGNELTYKMASCDLAKSHT
jgi:AraC-like DNA-binding protein